MMTIQVALLFLMVAALWLGLVVLLVMGLAAIAMWALVTSAHGERPRFGLRKGVSGIRRRMKLSSNGNHGGRANKEARRSDDAG